MSHTLTNHIKNIANNLLTQPYTTKLMLVICNVRDFVFFFFLSLKAFYVGS